MTNQRNAPQTITAHMLFKGDRFQLLGERVWQTMKEEPVIYPAANHVKLTARRDNGSTRQITLRLDATVAVWETEAR